MNEFMQLKISDICLVTDYVANGSFASLKENVQTYETPNYARLVRLVDHNAGWSNEGVYVDKRSYEFLKKSSVSSGDIVVSNVGANAGTVFFVPDLPTKATLGPNSILVRPNQKADHWFLYYWLSSESGQNSISNIISGSAQPKFNKTDFRNIELNLPPKEIQKRVSFFIKNIDLLIGSYKTQNTTLEALAQTLFRSWFVNFDPVHAKVARQTPEGMSPELAALFPSEFEESELGMIPKGWKYSQLKELADLQNGFAFKSKDWTDQGLPVLKIGNVLPLLVTKDGCSFVSEESVVGLERFRLSEGDILVGMTGYVGTTGLVPSSDSDMYLNQRVGKIVPTVEGSRSFVFCIARSNEFKVYCENNAAGSAQANISGKQILELGCAIPSDSILKAFDFIVSPLLSSILSNHSIALRLADIRDELLPRLISGKLRIEEAEEVVSEVLGTPTTEEKAA